MSESRRDEILSLLSAILREHCAVQGPISFDQRLADDLGLDSVGLLTLAVEAENRFQVVIRDDPERPPCTVLDLIRLIEQELAC